MKSVEKVLVNVVSLPDTLKSIASEVEPHLPNEKLEKMLETFTSAFTQKHEAWMKQYESILPQIEDSKRYDNAVYTVVVALHNSDDADLLKDIATLIQDARFLERLITQNLKRIRSSLQQVLV